MTEDARPDGGRGPYLPIAEHGVIGDLRTTALSGSDGAIDWFCAPRFDSPSVFGRLLDHDGGGHWSIVPAGPYAARQFYLPDSNVLATRCSSADGVVEVQDFMPIRRAKDPEHRQRLVRRVQAVRGRLELVLHLAPRFDYGRRPHTVEADAADGRVVFAGPGLALTLWSPVGVRVDGPDGRAEFGLSVGEGVTFVLDVTEDADERPAERPDAGRLQAETLAYWRSWIGRSRYRGRWQDHVHRSALLLKLLCHEPSGGVIAAPTMGLPEELGGTRNWDYRYVWIRDAAFTLYALLRLGFTEEAEAFMGWLTARIDANGEAAAGPEGPLRVVYDLDGRSCSAEVELDHWEGYRGSGPVRVGNAAADQLQLDIYGELIDSIYLYNKYSAGISLDAWSRLTDVVAWLSEHWDQPDEGIWEVRSGRRNHTYSRLMCWVALERMIRTARQRGLPGDIVAWSRTRDAIFADIVERGWSADRQAFVADDEGEVLDASLLLMPMVKFLAPTDPRFTATLAAIEESLVTDSLVFRYDLGRSSDGVDGQKGTFSICSFWYVEALTRVGRLDDARLALEKMFTYASPLGLYAEQIGLTGEQLGNFPQAFTHLALISAVVNLDRAFSGPG